MMRKLLPLTEKKKVTSRTIIIRRPQKKKSIGIHFDYIHIIIVNIYTNHLIHRLARFFIADVTEGIASGILNKTAVDAIWEENGRGSGGVMDVIYSAYFFKVEKLIREGKSMPKTSYFSGDSSRTPFQKKLFEFAGHVVANTTLYRDENKENRSRNMSITVTRSYKKWVGQVL